ncbi:hypothetical protein PAGL106935_13145 [Paenibacillus glucanolyticus]
MHQKGVSQQILDLAGHPLVSVRGYCVRTNPRHACCWYRVRLSLARLMMGTRVPIVGLLDDVIKLANSLLT